MSQDKPSPDSDLVQMAVTGLMLDPSSNVPIVILRDLARTLFLPIWVGVTEAQAIAIRLEGVVPPRPLTHDLLLEVCDRLGGRISRIVISDLRDGTFFAEIHLGPTHPKRALDARPSDAIALALRAGAPIYVRRTVLEQAQVVAAPLDDSDDEARIRQVLEQLDPNDPNRYKM